MEKQNRVEGAFKHAATDLRVEIVTPYHIDFDGVRYECLAYLPEFGSKNGMVVVGIEPPDYVISKELKNAAKENGFYCSFINMDSYLSYDSVSFTRMLTDWGYFGVESTKPIWLVDQADSALSP